MNEVKPAEPSTIAELFGRNHYSQHGEDGILEKVFALIGATSRLCVEFGAWDGFHMSNTANLWTAGWKGVLIEGNKQRYDELVRNVARYDCICVNAYVGTDSATGIEAILDREGVAADIDLLSIDIDGDDYFVLESLKRVRPRVLICEYNPTIPATLDLYGARGSSFGASAGAICRKASELGYGLISVTESNCIFVLQKDLEAFATFETRLDRIKTDRYLLHVITDFKGHYVLHGTPPYGLTVPYRGALTGDLQPVRFRGYLASIGHRWTRGARRLVRR